MCVASLTLIFTRSVGTLQPTRPFKMGFYSYPTLRMQIQPLNSLKTVSKVGDVSSTIAMTAHCFGALSQVRAIGHCVIGQERDLLWTWLAKLVGVSVSSSVQNTNFPHTLKLWNSRASGVIHKLLQELRQNINQMLDQQMAPHSSP